MNTVAVLVACFAPRRLLIVSATDDAASQDADTIVATAQAMCAAMGVDTHITHNRYAGEHALTQARFDDILHWLAQHLGRKLHLGNQETDSVLIDGGI